MTLQAADMYSTLEQQRCLEDFSGALGIVPRQQLLCCIYPTVRGAEGWLLGAPPYDEQFLVF